MRVRFFNTYEPPSTFYRDLVPYLAAAGHTVEIVISRAVYRDGRDLDEAIGHLNGVKIVRTINFGMQPTGIIAKALIAVPYAIHAALKSVFGPEVDCNVFLTQPPLFSVWGYVLSIIWRQPYKVVVMDISPAGEIEYGILRRDGVLTKLLLWLSSLAMGGAEQVIVIGRCMAERVKGMGVQPEHIQFIPNWIDERLVYPVDHERNELRRKWGLEGKFVVLHAGNMGVAHYFDDILAVAERLTDRDDIALVFIGDGSRYHEVKTQVEDRQLTNVLFFPFQDVSLWAQCFGVGDLHFVTYRENHTGLGVPSRSYAILAAARPILYQGSQEGEIARMILDEDIGVVVSCGDVEGLEQGILKYFNQPDLCQVQGHTAFALVQGPYSRLKALERYANLIIN